LVLENIVWSDVEIVQYQAAFVLKLDTKTDILGAGSTGVYNRIANCTFQ